jgi:hypothetical protein
VVGMSSDKDVAVGSVQTLLDFVNVDAVHLVEALPSRAAAKLGNIHRK